jgi:hypothetical protein
MKISYDKEADALYIDLIEGGFPRRAVQAASGVRLIFGHDERLARIELMQARHLLGGNGTPKIDLDGIAGESSNIHAGSKVRDIDDLRKKWKQEILRAAAAHGAREIRVFGSFARGASTAESDLDLLVGMEPKRTYLDFVGFWQDVEDALGCKVDVLDDGGISPFMRDRILREAVPL